MKERFLFYRVNRQRARMAVKCGIEHAVLIFAHHADAVSAVFYVTSVVAQKTFNGFIGVFCVKARFNHISGVQPHFFGINAEPLYHACYGRAGDAKFACGGRGVAAGTFKRLHHGFALLFFK